MSTLILVVIISNTIYNKVKTSSADDFWEYENFFSEMEEAFSDKKIRNDCFFLFDPNEISKIKLDSISIPDFVKRNIINYRKAGGKFVKSSDLKKIYGMNDSIFNLVQPFIKIKKVRAHKVVLEKEADKKIYSGKFDPNRAESEDFKKFGFNNFQIRNILSYRNKGGTFGTKNDLLKIYGVDSGFFSSIEKHIKLEKPQTTFENEPKVARLYIELNGSDSLQLIKLNGIGPVYAGRIIKYRNLLGGFYTKEQLLEVYNFPDETYRSIENSIFVDTTLINPIRINFAEYNDLLRHPYLNKTMVNAIISFREKNGAFEKNADLELVNGLDSFAYRKVLHYLTCH